MGKSKMRPRTLGPSPMKGECVFGVQKRKRGQAEVTASPLFERDQRSKRGQAPSEPVPFSLRGEGRGEGIKQESPAALGFHLPAEWERHEATWIGWPHNASDWPGKLSSVRWVYGEIVRKIVPGEIVRILVTSRRHEQRARWILQRVGVDLSRCEFFRIPTNRGWTRDFGPHFVVRREKRNGDRLELQPVPISTAEAEDRSSELAIVRFRFNGWARYPDWKKDDAVSEKAARALRLRVFHPRVRGQGVVLEGGAIDGNGRGTLVTTEECLLDQKTQPRNPKLGRKELEQVFRDYLGVTNVLWLGRGIAGDDTHGHIDDVCRFVGPRTVVLAREENPHDENYQPLEENRERLEGMRLEDGSKINVIFLPMPSPLYFDKQRLPASYANFTIANRAVLCPTFNDPEDRVALGILSELFPDRPCLGIHAVDLLWGLGTLHCLTREQPAV